MTGILIIISIYITTVIASDYTYWRYGDGSFTNSLPQNHTLFSNGLISNSPIYQHNTTSLNAKTIFFYPLISDTNEIFVLTNTSTYENFFSQIVSLTTHIINKIIYIHIQYIIKKTMMNMS